MFVCVREMQKDGERDGERESARARARTREYKMPVYALYTFSAA